MVVPTCVCRFDCSGLWSVVWSDANALSPFRTSDVSHASFSPVMDSRSRTDSEHHSWSPRARSGLPDPGSAPPVLSLDQIQVTGSSNEYTDGPTAPQTPEDRRSNVRSTNASTSPSEDVSLPSSGGGSQSSIRTSLGSVSSGQRLLGGAARDERIIRAQPTRAEQSSEEVKPPSGELRALAAVPGSRGRKSPDLHPRCETCGRCRCADCSSPRALPSCWLCGRRCMCSLQSAVEYGTCVCCVKGLFYHCSSDDEDTCVDKPFSCTQVHCCIRWATVSVLAALFPCLLCYLPAKACAAACQSCYDRVTRPGCRCEAGGKSAATSPSRAGA